MTGTDWGRVQQPAMTACQMKQFVSDYSHNLADALQKGGVNDSYKAYCLKCRQKKIIKDPEMKVSQVKKREVRRMAGTCPTCNGKVSLILPSKQ